MEKVFEVIGVSKLFGKAGPTQVKALENINIDVEL